MKKYLLIVVAVIALGVAIPVLSQFRTQGLSEGQRAPAFTLNDLGGNPISLGSLKGKVVMLNFWSAACPPCREEMPDMQRVYDDLKDDGFTILAVNVNDPPTVAAKFLEENGYTFPVVKDDGTVGQMYEVQYIPKTLIIDRNGTIRYVTVGALQEETLRSLVQKWL